MNRKRVRSFSNGNGPGQETVPGMEVLDPWSGDPLRPNHWWYF